MKTNLIYLILMTLLAACSSVGVAPETDGVPDTVNESTNDIAMTSLPTQALALQSNAPAPSVSGDVNSSSAGAMNLGQAGEAAVPGAVAMRSESDDDIEAEAAEEIMQEEPADMQFEEYGVNPFVETVQDNLSTFAMDVDTASYTLARNYLLQYNQLPPQPGIRAEEFINYYPMNYPQPQGDLAFAIDMQAAPSPFADDNQVLLRVGIQGRAVAAEDRDPALLIFVVDVSGSMDQTNRLGLAKQSLELLTAQLREDDRVGIVIYANEARVVLEPTPASEQQTILQAIQSLRTEGSTYAEAGLAMAYNMAQSNMRAGETTRVVLVSDGVANVGATGPDAILDTVSQGVDSGITLSTVGVGMGNFNDVMMEQLANDGNGNYHYVDTLREARRIFVNNLTSTLQVIGYDARIQVEFNPDVVTEYRLIGYENRAIADQDFRNDTIDAGEVGAGHTITALYELVLVDSTSQSEIATAYLRYEDAPSRDVVEINETFTVDLVAASFDEMPFDFQLNATVAEFSEILRGSEFGTADYQTLLGILQPFAANDPYVEELIMMIEAAMQFS